MSIEYVYVKKYIQQPRIVKNYPEKKVIDNFLNILEFYMHYYLLHLAVLVVLHFNLCSMPVYLDLP